MIKKKDMAAIKELIIAKKLLQKSEEFINVDSMENNLVAIFSLNSALNIILSVLSQKQKIKSIKQLNNVSLEKQWSILSEVYKQRYGHELSMKTQIFTLNNIISDFIDHDIIPANTQIKELCQALTVFIDELVFKVFNIEFSELDFHLLLEHPQVSQSFKSAREAYDAEQYEVVLKDTSLAFHIALEEQRQKLNYLSEKGLLKPELLMLDKSIELHINPKDQDFIHLVLGTQPTKLEKFKQMVPTILISEDDKKRPEIIVSDFVDDSAISKENAEFCLNFVLETILKWEGLDLVKTTDIKNVNK